MMGYEHLIAIYRFFEPRTPTLIAVRADRWRELPDFLDALREWGCDDPALAAAEIKRFLQARVGLDQYRATLPDGDGRGG